MFPALRTAWLVVPTRWWRVFNRPRSASPDVLWQQTLADFIQQGHFWRHLKKMRASYASADSGWSRRCRRRAFRSRRSRGDSAGHAGQRRRSPAGAAGGWAGLAVQALSDWRIRHAGEGDY
jgi:GntR family transcriptional regulator/MocR family aminotransferase